MLDGGIDFKLPGLYNANNIQSSAIPNAVLITSASGVASFATTLPSTVQNNITSVGTITSGTWNGTILTGTYGGTGVNNGSNTITIGGNVSFSGSHTFTGTVTGNTNVTFPTSGTLSTTTGTVTSVTYTGDGILLSATPTAAVTTSGTLRPVLNTQTANFVLVGPASGSAATPTFRALVPSDIPGSSPSGQWISQAYTMYGGF